MFSNSIPEAPKGRCSDNSKKKSLHFGYVVAPNYIELFKNYQILSE